MAQYIKNLVKMEPLVDSDLALFQDFLKKWGLEGEDNISIDWDTESGNANHIVYGEIVLAEFKNGLLIENENDIASIFGKTVPKQPELEGIRNFITMEQIQDKSITFVSDFIKENNLESVQDDLLLNVNKINGDVESISYNGMILATKSPGDTDFLPCNEHIQMISDLSDDIDIAI
ncbi:hypothetical protein SAMN05216391_10968 [Lachnospiraceae bacterium KHCPX20]|nr:hypothetical protein SAMN05216391_10968 [Lachnospiraceae bacterium KHCPX20]